MFASVGDTVELIAATNVNGKPTPSTLWRINNHPIEVSGRYSAEVAGQLLIQNIVVADFGVYNFIASNGIGENLTTEIILSEIGIYSTSYCNHSIRSCLLFKQSWELLVGGSLLL